MMGIEIARGSKSIWVPVAALSAVLAIALGIWIGPNGIYGASGAGFLSALLALIRRAKMPSYVAGRGVPITLLCVHAAFLVVGLTLESLFLRPLAESSLQIPRLSTIYNPPESFFHARIPDGWSAESIHVPRESGVRLRPTDRAHYMGISELIIRVRELRTPEVKQPGFLKRMAETFSSSGKNAGRLFQFTTEPAALLNGGEGLWSKLVVKRFWVPVYQLSLFGIKNNRYLCSVSATGLKSHATLSEVMCLGVYETIRIGNSER